MGNWHNLLWSVSRTGFFLKFSENRQYVREIRKICEFVADCTNNNDLHQIYHFLFVYASDKIIRYLFVELKSSLFASIIHSTVGLRS